ncbi:MAG: substrate-binding domain-containing protein [Vicinamibacterales bacterium]
MQLLRAVLAAFLSQCWACAGDSVPARLTLATTTSVVNSGLLDTLIPAFKRESGIDVRPVPVGSGRALQLLISGAADVAITHAPDAEAKTLKDRPGWLYRKIMFNGFQIVGPPADPAHVKDAATAIDAMQRIAGSGVVFVSRGDSSGTHETERRLWALARTAPPAGKLIAAGSGMGATLKVAASVAAYTLTDDATFAQHAPQLQQQLAILFEGGPDLLNTYAVIVPSDRTRTAGYAQQFATWLTTGAGRAAIDAYTVGPQRQRAFIVWPADVPRDEPQALPR